MKYLKSKKIIHRDIKLENILLINDTYIKIIDFDLSTFYPSDDNYLIGTIAYVAPEVYNDKIYHYSNDVWSLGILTFILIYGKYPFGDSLEFIESRQRINLPIFKRGDYSINSVIFIKDLLKYDYKERISIENINNHNWLNN